MKSGKRKDTILKQEEAITNDDIKEIYTEITMNGNYELGKRNLNNYQIHTILMVLMASKKIYNIIKQEYRIQLVSHSVCDIV